MAIDHAVWLALTPRADLTVRIRSLDLEVDFAFDLNSLTKGEGWIEYVKGVAYELQKDGHALRGFDAVMTGDVPRGAGLSSSAAVELATARAFAAVSEKKLVKGTAYALEGKYSSGACHTERDCLVRNEMDAMLEQDFGTVFWRLRLEPLFKYNLKCVYRKSVQCDHSDSHSSKAYRSSFNCINFCESRKRIIFQLGNKNGWKFFGCAMIDRVKKESSIRRPITTPTPIRA